jgi:two-component system, NtrC family, response regulator HydG
MIREGCAAMPLDPKIMPSATSHRSSDDLALPGIIGCSQALREVLRTTRQVAPSRACVLIVGETGTGKELIARAVHDLSPRSTGPYIRVNCGALTESLLESELFGHVKGAFTGADKDRIGRFQYANGGTLFLDEIGDMPISIQVKLLRVLESGEIVRVGTNEPVKVNVRLISATNRDLGDAINEGKFRQDLYHRLKVVSVKLPPLRERREDIPLLIDHFLKEFTASHGKTITVITPAVRKTIMAYSWPGNVRELKNTIESMVVLDSDGQLDLDDMTEDLQAFTSSAKGDGPSGVDSLVGQSLEEIEKHYILETLKRCNGNREEAARQLGIGERTLYRKLKEYNLG